MNCMVTVCFQILGIVVMELSVCTPTIQFHMICAACVMGSSPNWLENPQGNSKATPIFQCI